MHLRNILFLVLLLSFALIFAGCSAMSANTKQCKEWQSQGEFMGSLRSCAQCIDKFGNGNKNAVKGCALAMDAGSLF